MHFKIESFIATDGERFSQLYNADELGFPLFYPTAFISTSIRLTTTHETQKVYLEAIKRVCEWEAQKSTDLATRFMRREFLTLSEIDDLAQHLRAARNQKSNKTISVEKGNTYIQYASKYLTWLAHKLISDVKTAEVLLLIETQEKWLKAKVSKKTGSQSEYEQKVLGKYLPENVRDQLIELWRDPFAKLTEDKNRGQRLRCIVMLRILYETGMRRGEMLSLKLKNLLESTGGDIARLVIERNHNDIYDSRVHQPVAKTSGRVVPISPELEQQLLQYISEYRADVRNAAVDDEAIIFITHRSGRGQGKPLSISNFAQSIDVLKQQFPALAILHPHLLRHDWNYRFSRQADIVKMDKAEQTAKRETLMGWRTDSDMGRIYNQRHLQEQSLHFGLKVANDTCR